MRILTVRQPWAWALIHGGKDVENRTTNLAGSYRGPVAIHAALTVDEAGVRSDVVRAAWDAHRGGDWLEAMIVGAIIGVVDLTGVHFNPGRSERWDATLERNTTCSLWAEHGPIYHLEVANARPLTSPIPYRGVLGLRHLSPEVSSQVLENLDQ